MAALQIDRDDVDTFYTLHLQTDDRLPWNGGPGVRRGPAINAYEFRASPINIRQNWAISAHELHALHERDIEGESLHPPPTGLYEQHETIMGVAWPGHVTDTKRLINSLAIEEYAGSFGLQAMLRVICQGLPGVTALPRHINIRRVAEWANGSSVESDPRLRPADELVEADLPNAAETRRIRSKVWNRRFIVTFFCFERSKHWVAAVFDQAYGTLYLYDTAHKDRRIRTKAAGLAWRSFALNLGMPCDIRVVSPPLAEQRGGWQCGYIGLVNIMLSVRCLQGNSWDGLFQRGSKYVQAITTDGRPPSRIPVFPGPKDNENGLLHLLIPDWRLGAHGSAEGWRRARSVVFAMLLNELGIPSLNRFLRTVSMSPRDDYYGISFGRTCPGDIITLTIHTAATWTALPTLYSSIYSEDRPLMHGLINYNPQRDGVEWPPDEYQRALLRRCHGRTLVTGSIDDLVRHRVRCWNSDSQVYSREEPVSQRINETDRMDLTL